MFLCTCCSCLHVHAMYKCLDLYKMSLCLHCNIYSGLKNLTLCSENLTLCSAGCRKKPWMLCRMSWMRITSLMRREWRCRVRSLTVMSCSAAFVPFTCTLTFTGVWDKPFRETFQETFEINLVPNCEDSRSWPPICRGDSQTTPSEPPSAHGVLVLILVRSFRWRHAVPRRDKPSHQMCNLQRSWCVTTCPIKCRAQRKISSSPSGATWCLTCTCFFNCTFKKRFDSTLTKQVIS